MTPIAMRVEALGKAYPIERAHNQGHYQTLREDLTGTARRALQRIGQRVEGWIGQGGAALPQTETFWALQNISFELHQGDVLGIIGRNGAGKSTLLKILARISPPTTGCADVYGRLGALLEVGTGFHPELTGRENIFLSGAVLGMSRRDIQRQFDAIAAFAEVEKFLETPVKRYSSGMYMRLAFSVAAHLEPEILIVDEVLAVGDAEFQRKCLGKMNDVAQSGRTVLFVSHSMAAVQQLCTRGLVLERGQIAYQGTIPTAIDHYLRLVSRTSQSTSLLDRVDRQGSGTVRFTRVEICDDQGTPIERVLSGQAVRFRFHYAATAARAAASVNLAFNIYNPHGLLLTHLNTRDVGQTTLPIGTAGYFECVWPRFNLRSGVYTSALYCEIDGQIADWLQGAFQIQVEDGNFYGTGSLFDRGQGDVLVDYRWRSAPTPGADSTPE